MAAARPAQLEAEAFDKVLEIGEANVRDRAMRDSGSSFLRLIAAPYWRRGMAPTVS
jgi:hypothetical protein